MNGCRLEERDAIDQSTAVVSGILPHSSIIDPLPTKGRRSKIHCPLGQRIKKDPVKMA